MLWLTIIFGISLVYTTLGFHTIIRTNYGKVGGVVKRTNDNGTYLSFAGIPFAKPPVGKLRFANPEKPESWEGVLDGSRSSQRCVQRNFLLLVDPPVEGVEDCLYLNVYIPLRKNGTIGKTVLPVIVSIPWGGFIVEGGDEGYFDPTYFMDYDVILVTFNYRVGVFGFLSTLDDEAPGNLALKDQVLALQWVQENIEHFGGNKKNVTIMGQSAGAGSVSYHIISPASRGLFNKAISQSGAALAPWATTNNGMQGPAVLKQAELVNCSEAIGNSTTLIDCLRKVPAEDLARSQDGFKFFYNYPFSTFLLVTENKTERNPNPFLTKTPVEYIRAGEFQKVPWIVGNVKNEGLLVASGLLGPEQIRNDFNKSFDNIIKTFLSFNDSVYQNVSKQYFGGKNYVNNDEEWEQGFVDMWSDSFFIYSTYQTVSLQVANGHNSIYFYSFEYSGEYTFTGLVANSSNILFNPNWSIAHADDLLFQFKMPDLFKKQLTSVADKNLSKTWISLWVNFATYGDPNPSENVILKDIRWKPLQLNYDGSFENKDMTVLNVTGSYHTGAKFNITQGFYKKRMEFWKENS